ncbi:MAG: PEGA domain-containing protein [Anaerolineaceae bacterium]|nr:MAG: PEGA domain-containing protein [Anaerolineaceae bacterium]
MAVKANEQKNKSRIHIRPILSLLIGLTFFTTILIIALFEAGKSGRPSVKQTTSNQTNQDTRNNTTGFNIPDKSTTAVVLEADKSSMTIKLYDIADKEEIILNYTGGTSLLDKYGQFISIDRIEKGLIVDVSYQSEKNKLTELKFSEKAWEYIGVNNMTIYPDVKTIKIARSNYTYDEPFVVDGDSFVLLDDLAIQDELTVRGIDETIWSIIVTKGHGTVKIKDYEAFIGGSITVGYEAVMQITEGMTITTREGNYNLTVENGEYSGTKNITVNRNEETVVSVGDLGPEPVKYGKTTFDITPFGADLFIDKELTNYASPVELAYGEHSIEVSLGGYSTYRGNLRVDYSGKKIQIVLPELQSKDNVSIVEWDDPEANAEEEHNYNEYNDWDSDQDYNGNYPDYIDSLVDDEDYDDDPIIDNESLIYIQNPSGASVYLNGEYKGVSPGSFQKVIGNHVITFIKQGYQTKSYTVDIADDGLDTYISLPDLDPSR